MRKIIATEFLSLDGVMEGPGPDDPFELAGWTMSYWANEIGKFKFDEIFASDALLLGRVTYQGFASAWPSRTDEAGFAERMNNLPKYVVSTTLQAADWKNSTLIKDNIAEQVSGLKQQPGQDILIAGSSRLVETLMQLDLIDEYRLLVYPLVLGRGKRLFKDGIRVNLKLVESMVFPSGVTALTYHAVKK
jgi:dihydrofolate reductase